MGVFRLRALVFVFFSNPKQVGSSRSGLGILGCLWDQAQLNILTISRLKLELITGYPFWCVRVQEYSYQIPIDPGSHPFGRVHMMVGLGSAVLVVSCFQDSKQLLFCFTTLNLKP